MTAPVVVYQLLQALCHFKTLRFSQCFSRVDDGSCEGVSASLTQSRAK